MTVDIDDFKGINDAHGHAAGDLLLGAIAQRLRTALRSADIPARLGGDEFAVLLEGMDARGAGAVARRVLAELRQPLVVDGAEVWPTASIGVAATTGDLGGDELMRHADIAAYEAKSQGKNRVEVFTTGMRSGALTRAAIALDLRRAVDRDELFLEYQPVVRLRNGEIVGVEALVRWRHPERGVVSPGEFIPVAEETGLIVPLGAWVLREACRQVQVWRAALAPDRPLRLSVNVSPRQMRERDFVGTVREIMASTGFDPTHLVLEVTEGALVDNVSEARQRLEQLRAAGVRVALDDFGTGYSSIGYLRGLPLDAVKIDRVFVAGLAGDSAARELALAVVRLVDTLGLPVIAEGVETVEEVDYVGALGVDFGQGHHFSPPIDPDRMAALLAGPGFEGDGVAPRRPRRSPQAAATPSRAQARRAGSMGAPALRPSPL
jgi:diguanylate cyclase (GGDEF)-like protein